MYLLSCVHFRSFHAVALAAEVAMAPITKAFPTFSGALIVADALSNFGEFSVLIYFFHFGISQLFHGRLWTGSFHLNQFKLFKLFNCIDFLHPPLRGNRYN